MTEAEWLACTDPAPMLDFLQAMAAAGSSDPERRRQCAWLRDLFGPFRPRPVISPSWLSWKDDAVAKLAWGVYVERSFDRLPILADALEDAGCSEPALLGHCRSEGPHARLLGRGRAAGQGMRT
jgi:hypothetical protein